MVTRNVAITPGSGDQVEFENNNQVIKLKYGSDILAEQPATAAKQVSAEAKLDTLVASLASLLAELETKFKSSPADFSPGYSRQNAGAAAVGVDADGNLLTRTLTDEGTSRVNFANSSLAITLAAATYASLVFTGTGIGADGIDLEPGDYVQFSGDAESTWVRVESIDDEDHITVASAYTGSTSGTLTRTKVRPVTGAGGSITVGSGQCTMTLGTTALSVTGVERFVDYAPIIGRAVVSVSQRIANQAIHIGFRENAPVPRWFARFELDGTVDTVVRTATGRNPTGAPSASEQELQTITLPGNLRTLSLSDFRVEVLTERVLFYFQGIRVAIHSRVVPAQHDEMEFIVEGINGTTPATNTTVVVDYASYKNHNKVEVGILSDSEQIVAANAQDELIGTYNVAGVITINTDLLVLDVSKYAALYVQCVAMGTTGVVTPAFSGDDGATYSNGQLVPLAGGAIATTFNAAGGWIVPKCGPKFRLRLTTATTAGTTTLRVWGLAQPPAIIPTSITVTATNLSSNSAQVGGGTWATTTPATNRGAAVAAAAPASNADVASAARTATGNSGTIADDFAGACAALLVVSAQSGTSPTLDVTLEESYDNGTTWQTIWAFPRFAGATGNARMPQIPIGGRRRWVWTIAGTTPSFTFAITAMRGTVANAVVQRQYFDRTANLLNGTLNATSATFDMAGCKAVCARFTAGAITTTPGQYKLQCSDDGVNWTNATTTAVPAVASSTVLITADDRVQAPYWRLICTSAATGQTGTHASLYGVN